MAVDLNAALTAFNSAGIDLCADFHTLSSAQVCVIVECANNAGYRKPKNASGSTARYYFAALQRKSRAANNR